MQQYIFNRKFILIAYFYKPLREVLIHKLITIFVLQVPFNRLRYI